MVDLTLLQQVAHVVVDENGMSFVQIPLPVWEAVVEGTTSAKHSQNEEIRALLDAWDKEPNDRSPEWWDEFQQFLKENRVHFRERDLGLDD